MTKKTRNWLFAIFVALFFILAAVILLYAFGYNLSGYGLKLQKTGLLDIKTKPAGATIYLNGQPRYKGWVNLNSNDKKPLTAPAKLANLNPGEYQVRLYLDGYLPWEKKLRVESGATTYLENVRLFKNSLPYSIADFDQNASRASAFSPNLRYFAIASQDKINIVELKTKMVSASWPRTGQAEPQLTWSADSKWLLADNQIFKPDGSLAASLPGDAVNANFSHSDSNIIYFAHAGAIKTFDLNNQQLSSFRELDQGGYVATDWLVKDGYVHLLSQNKQSRYWQLELYDGRGNFLSKAELKLVSDLKFGHQDSKWINIEDAKNRHLYLVSLGYPLNANYDIRRIEDVAYYDWLEDEELLIAGEFDLRIWRRQDNKEQFLTRLGSPLTFAAWHNDDNYIIFADKNNVSSLELDTRDGHQIISLAKFNQLTKAALSPTGDSIFLEGLIGQRYGLYVLDIQ